MALILHLTGASAKLASIFAASFGLIGLLVILLFSTRMKKMVHCTVYCPIGAFIRYAKYLNPFRMSISSDCTDCMACIKTCHYDALNQADIEKRKPGSSCTLCGDCISSCHVSAIRYRFFSLSANKARHLWLVLTVVIHAVFLGLARL